LRDIHNNQDDKKNKIEIFCKTVTKHQNELIHLDLHMTKPSDDVVDKMLDNTMLNMDHKTDTMLVLKMSYKNETLMMMILVD
jgi:hypothetical protein